MSLNAPKTSAKIYNIFSIPAGVDDFLIFLTGTGVLDDVLDGLHMHYGSYVKTLIEICQV